MLDEANIIEKHLLWNYSCCGNFCNSHEHVIWPPSICIRNRSGGKQI